MLLLHGTGLNVDLLRGLSAHAQLVAVLRGRAEWAWRRSLKEDGARGGQRRVAE